VFLIGEIKTFNQARRGKSTVREQLKGEKAGSTRGDSKKQALCMHLTRLGTSRGRKFRPRQRESITLVRTEKERII